MVSVLIPVYNYNVTDLVKELYNQAVASGVQFEIIVMDDGSQDLFKKQNREMDNYEFVKYIELEQNIGRSRIRNKLADIAKYNNLIFLDCDSKINRNDFISNYVKCCSEKEYVVYGGRIYEENRPLDDYFLHWHYGKNREELSSSVRSVQPNSGFMTNNFMINKKLFNKIRFNEFIRRYGHEDTLFGYELKKYKIKITHIDNPLIHEGLEKNDEFIRKTQAGLYNLKFIIGQNGYLKDLVNDITILKYYTYIKTLRLTSFIRFFFSSTKPFLLKNLCGKKPNLILFDFFKLGYLTSVMLKK